MISPSPKKIAILGSTGSIGRSTLDVVRSLPGRFEVVALAAGHNLETLARQAAEFRPRLLSVREPSAIPALREKLQALALNPLPQIANGSDGLTQVAIAADMTVAAIVGVAGLAAIHAALERGGDIALANKEALVVAGPLLLAAAQRSGARILPVDSEHSAIHQCLRGGQAQELHRLILTASGGPFLRLSAAELDSVTPAQALRHPTWNMGDRVTLDSATLMNKGFEVIEACHLFGLAEDRVDVLVHPQSIVHSMVEFCDGSVLAQLGTADMRTPIQYALTYPERAASTRLRLKLEEVGKLDFELPDMGRFPCLRLAREAWRAGGTAAVALNAADEVAVRGFCDGVIPFSRIADVVEATLSHTWGPAADLPSILAADARARRLAAEHLRQRA